MSSVQGDNDKKDNMESDIMFGLKTLTQIPMHKVTGENKNKIETKLDMNHRIQTLYSTMLVESRISTAYNS